MNVKSLIMAATIVMNGAVFAYVEFADGKLAGDTYAIPITISGVPDEVELAEFPVLVRISPQLMPGFKYSQFGRADHADLMFVDADGGLLPYEIDTWNEAGESLVWVRVRTLVKGATFKMCYGGTAAVQSSSQSVWSAYAAVYHFNGSEVDSAAASIPYSLRGTAELSENGIVGGGFASGNAGAATCGQPWSEIPGSPSKSIAISGWVKPSAEATAAARIFSTKGGDYSENGLELMFVPTGGIYFRGNGGSVTWTWMPDPVSSAYPVGEWTHYVASLEGNNISFFLNGVQPAETGWVWDFQPRGDRYLSFGAVATDACGGAVNGLLDELRVYRGAMPADWARAEYDSVHDPDYLVYGQIQKDEPLEFFRQVPIAVVGVQEGVVLTDFPVLVRLSPQLISGFRYSQFRRADHADMMFVDDEGYSLSYEIDTWDESGTSLVWVRVRTLKKGGAITMFYGSTKAVQSSSQSVWNAYAAVYHFNGSEVDSAAASIPYSLRGTAELSEDGIVGGGFASGNAGAATCGQPWSEIPGSPSKSIAISGWVKPSAETSARIFSTKGSDAYENGVELIFVANAGIYFRGNGGSVTWTWTPDPVSSAYPVGEWTHYVASLEGNNISFFLNGVQPAETGWVWDFQPRGDRYLSFGAVATDACGGAVNGLLDELRVYRGAMPADWARAEYDSVHDPDYLVYGAASAVHPGLMVIFR